MPKPVFNQPYNQAPAPLTSEPVNETAIMINITNLEVKIDKLIYAVGDLGKMISDKNRVSFDVDSFDKI
jgi:hypothetical protein